MKAQDYIASGLLEAYVLGSLPLAGMEQVAGAMCRFPEVKEEVASIEALFITAEEEDAVAPPPGLQDKIWASIQAGTNGASTMAEGRSIATLPAGPEIATASDVPTGSKVIPLNTTGRSTAPAWARAAIWIALAGSVVANYVLFSNRSGDRQQLASLQQQVDTMGSRQTALLARVNRYEEEAEMVASPGIQPVAMLSTQPGHPMAATIYWNKAEHKAWVSVQKLPPPPAGMQYQLWAIADGRPVSIGMLENEVAANGGMQKVTEAVMDSQAFAVSLEKAGGNPAPTADKIFLLGKMPV